MVTEPNRIEEVFSGALQSGAGPERTAYLDAACGDDAALRERVEALLQASEAAGDFLATAALGGEGQADGAGVTEGPGTAIGPYKLLEKIGEGGMAVVYMAQQDKPLRRRVALKIIKLGMDTRQVIARFEAERQALAMMDHPGIARVLDAGATETGRPYFVMELVQGVSITEYCDGNSLGTGDRLALFLQVCHAVQHAHQKGIIHRDIKPSNVMVTHHDGQPIPKVIDFGIAKATNQRLTEKTLFTRYAHIIGTPAYMSPEQAELSDLDIDTRSDIYSLGVLLYELLTGTPPFSEEELRKAGYLEMQRVIREQEPAKPSTKLGALGETLTEIAKHRSSTPDLLMKAVQGDLDWIVMKSLEKDRGRRYETAQALAADVVRHLSHEPVQAVAPSASYRLRKFVRRHRIGVLVGLLAVVLGSLTICALAVSTVLVWRAQGRTQRALEREQQALDQETGARLEAQRAQAQEEQARKEAERQAGIAQAVSDFLTKDLLTSVDPARARGREVTVRETLDAASTAIQGRFADDPLIEASVRLTLGDMYVRLGRYTEATPHLERAHQLYQERLGPEDFPWRQAIRLLGILHGEQGRYREAEALFLQVGETVRRVLGEEHPEYLGTAGNLALLYSREGRYEEAEALYLKTLQIQKRVLGESHPDTLGTMHNLAGLYSEQGRDREAETSYRQVIEGRERWLGQDHPATLFCMNDLAVLFNRQHRCEEAEALFLKTWEAMRRVLGEEHPYALRPLANLAGLYTNHARYAEAEPLLLKILETHGRVLGDEHPDTLASLGNLAILYFHQGRHQEAEALYLRVMEIESRILGEDHPHAVISSHHLGNLYKDQQRYEEAERLYLRTVEIRERILGRDHPRTVSVLRVLIELYDAWGKPEEAQTWRSRLPGFETGPTAVAPSRFSIPAGNLTIPEELQACAGNLRAIHAAIVRYRDEKDAWPHWLADLVPDYLAAATLLCPADPVHKAKFSPDPRLPCSYSWELSSAPVPRGWDRTGKMLYRDWKMQQTKVFGDVVPMVRCAHHGDDQVLSLSIAGQIFCGPLDWEYMLKKDYRFGEEQPDRLLPPAGEAPVLSTDVPIQPLSRVCLPEGKRLVAGGGKASWSPDGTRLVFGRVRDQGLRILDLDSGGTVDLAASGKDPAWSPDGRFIAYVDRAGVNQPEEVWLISSSGGTPRRVAEAGYPGWSAEGKTLFVQSRQENRILSFEVDNPHARAQVFFDGPQSWYPAVSPDGGRIAFGRRDELVIMDRRTREIVLTWPVPGRRGLLPAWSPDGRQVAFGGFDTDPFGVWVLDVEAEETVRIAEGLYTMPAWSPDGTRLAFDHRSGDVREIWLVPTEAIRGPRLNAAQAAQVSKLVLDPRVLQPRSPVARSPEVLLVGRPAPGFTVADLDGRLVSLSDFRGKVVLLDFWATWCPPCVKAIPHLEALHERYKDDGLVLLGLNNEPDQPKVRQFAQGSMSYPVLPGADKPFRDYGVQAIPTLFYVDREGLVRHQESGFSDGKEKDIEARVKELLGL